MGAFNGYLRGTVKTPMGGVPERLREDISKYPFKLRRVSAASSTECEKMNAARGEDTGKKNK